MDIVYDYLENQVGLSRNDIIVVGVSSGPDSMALLYVLDKLQKKIGYKIVVAHINHNVRHESYEEAEFLKKYCEDRNIVFEMMIIEQYGDDNFHNEARTIRYNFYEDIINKYHANYLMTGHHGDDLMETILMRIVRGSTLKGYSGFNDIILRDKYKIVRPLIFLTKDEIQEFDDKNNIEYRIDKSNYKDKYTRNRYRKNVLPFLKQEDKNVHRKFLKFSKTLMEYDSFINSLSLKIINDIYQDGIIDINKFKMEHELIQKRMIDYIFSIIYNDDIIEIDDRHVDLVLKAIYSSKNNLQYSLPNDYLVVKDGNKLYFKKNITIISNYDIELSDEVFLPNGMTIRRIDSSKLDGNDIMRLNSQDILLPLRVRTRRDGDKMSIKNMNGTKKVSDILINSKIPLSKRDTWPIVVDSNNTIVWIPKVKKSKYNRLKEEKCDIIFKCY